MTRFSTFSEEIADPLRNGCRKVGSQTTHPYFVLTKDKIGMYFSLFGTSLVFFTIQYITGFYSLCIGVFSLTIVADMFRPAIWVALDDYSSEENRTRSVTLIRLAINLGFSMGPALGGLLITYVSYRSLFWVDGLTCLIAGLNLNIKDRCGFP